MSVGSKRRSLWIAAAGLGLLGAISLLTVRSVIAADAPPAATYDRSTRPDLPSRFTRPDNPALFAERRIYRLRELAVSAPAELLEVLRAEAARVHSLDELAAWLREHDRSRFLLTAPPLRLPGIVGSPTTPIATV